MKIAPLEAVQNRRVEGAQGSQCFPFTGISRDFLFIIVLILKTSGMG